MNRKTIYTSAAVFLALAFATCDMAGPEDGQIPASGEKAAVRVIIGSAGTQSRTVAPGVELEETDWRLLGGKSGEAETPLKEFSGDEDRTVYLEPGTWGFTLEGYKDDALILSGNIAEQNIRLEGTNILEFTVAPVMGGEGTVSITIGLPDGSGITEARIFKDGTELETPVTPVDNRIVFEQTYPAGDYYFSVRLYKDADLYGAVSEVVQVRTNLESRKTYTLVLENLNRTYVITYHLWEGETDFGYFRQTEAGVTLIEPSREGYIFRGWYEEADFSGEAVTEVPAGSTGDKDFYARWVAQYTVTFDADGGSPETQTRVVNSGDSVGSSQITSITYSSVSGGTWTLLDDGRRRSPAIGHNGVTKARISFTSTVVDASITIRLDVSSEERYDFAFISTLDNANATYNSGYYEGSRISGTQSVEVTIPVPTTGSHFIDIGYQKYGSGSGSDCAWFEVTSGDSSGSTMPSDPTRSGYGFGGWYTAANGGGSQFTADTTVTGDITVYARWNPGVSVQVVLQPVSDVPPLSSTSIFENQEAQFSAGSGYVSWTWYWDGEIIGGVNTSAYTLAAYSKAPGIYELSVVVTTGTGARLSARCLVTIKTQ